MAFDLSHDRARGSGWTDIGVPLRDVVLRVADSGVKIALVTGIERDGAMSGPNLDLLTKVQTIAPTLELIASGGIDSLHSIAAVGSLRCEGAIIGRALYEGSLTLPDAIATASNENRNIT